VNTPGSEACARAINGDLLVTSKLLIQLGRASPATEVSSESPLAYVLRDALDGSTQVTLLATASPALMQYKSTHGVLKMADMCKGTPAAPPPLNKGSYLGSKGAGSRSTPRTTQGGKGSGRGSGPVKTQNSSCTPAMKPEKYKSPSDLMWLRNYLSSRGAPNADIEANCHSLLELRHLGVTLGLLQPTADEEVPPVKVPVEQPCWALPTKVAVPPVEPGTVAMLTFCDPSRVNSATLVKKISSPSALKIIFAKMDIDDDGFISKDEFKNAMAGSGKHDIHALLDASGVEWEKVYHNMDTNGDNFVSLEEFVQAASPKFWKTRDLLAANLRSDSAAATSRASRKKAAWGNANYQAVKRDLGY